MHTYVKLVWNLIELDYSSKHNVFCVSLVGMKQLCFIVRRKVNYQHPSKLKYHLQKTISLKIIWTCSNTSIPTKIRFISDILIGNLLHLALIQYRIISIRIMFVLLKTPNVRETTIVWYNYMAWSDLQLYIFLWVYQ